MAWRRTDGNKAAGCMKMELTEQMMIQLGLHLLSVMGTKNAAWYITALKCFRMNNI